MFEGKTVAVIVPAYREERLIGRMLRRLPLLIDAVYVKWDIPFRAKHWPADLRERLTKHAWLRDHKQFTAVVVAVGRMWAGLSEHNAVKGLGATQTVRDWLTGLGLGWESA